MKHKLGDIVQIKSLDWYNENKDKDGGVRCQFLFASYMNGFCGRYAKITGIQRDSYKIDIDKEYYFWTDDMFEKDLRRIKIKATTNPLAIGENYILSDKLTSIDELDELKRNKECVAWCHSDGYTYTMRSASFFMNWSYGILKTRLSNMYKVIKKDKANIIVEALAKENIIHGENVKKAVDITRKILNKNE